MKGFADVVTETIVCVWLMLAASTAAAQVASAPSANAARAQDTQAMDKLARQRNCMTCHAVDRTLLAPSYRDIAKRYAGQPGAADNLARTIADGSRGKWGSIPMPASPQLAPGEAGRLARWILGLGH